MTQTAKQIVFGKPMLGESEKKAVAEVLNGPILVHGPRSKEFEADFAAYTGSPHAVCVSSCTAALHLCYFYLGLKSGDEVIVPAQTHVATVHAVELCGAKPVFVDAELRTGNIDIEQIERAVTPNTKALSVVHFLGMPAAMDRLMEIAGKHELFVVEDCALALSARYRGKHVGLWGDAGCFSFYPVKHMTTAEGGMLITRHRDVAAGVNAKKAFGVDRHMGERTVPGMYDVTDLGFNYRMNEIEAAIGIEQIKRVDENLKRREANFNALYLRLREMDELDLFETDIDGCRPSYYCLSVLVKKPLAARRVEIMRALGSSGIGSSIYYPSPVPHFTYYRNKYGYKTDTFPVARQISDRSISLPVGPHLDPEDMKTIADALTEAIQQQK